MKFKGLTKDGLAEMSCTQAEYDVVAAWLIAHKDDPNVQEMMAISEDFAEDVRKLWR